MNDDIKRKIASASAIMMSFTLVGNLLGFFREILIGAKFGTSKELDVFIVAYMIPNMLVAVLVQSLAVTFLPVFTEKMTRESEERGWEIANGMLSMTLVVIGAVTLIGILIAPLIVMAIAPGFKGPERDLAIQLTRLMLLTTPLFAVSGLLQGILHSYKHFVAPALVSIGFNLLTVLGVIYLVPIWGIWGYAISVVAGVFTHILIQLPPLWKKRRFFRFSFKINTPENKKMLALALPIVFGMMMSYINNSVDKILASMSVEGAISSLHYAQKVKEMIVHVFTMSMASAMFPFFSQYSAEKNEKGLVDLMSVSCRISGYILIPLTALMCVLSFPFIRLLFERGNFDKTSTAYVSSCLFYYALSIYPFHINRILNNLFYSLKNMKTPVKISAVGVVLNIVLDLILIRVMGFVGLALATSITYYFTLVARLLALNRTFEKVEWGKIFVPIAKITLASLIAGLAVIGLMNLPVDFLASPEGMYMRALSLCALGLSGLVIYYVAGKLMDVRESKTLLKFLGSRFRPNGRMRPDITV